MLELLHAAPNGYHLKPLIALHEKSLPFASRPIAARIGAPWFGDTEVFQTLELEGPILLDDGRPITDALFINQYLDDRFPATRLAPDTPIGRYDLLAWGRLVAETLAPAIHTLGCAAFPPGPPPADRDQPPERARAWQEAASPPNPALLAESRRKAQIAIDRIEQALQAGPFLLGAAYTLADIEVFGHAISLPLLLPETANEALTPRLIAWLERVRARPAVQHALQTGNLAEPLHHFVPGPEHSRWG